MSYRSQILASLVTACLAAVAANPVQGQVTATSTWATNIVIDPQLRNPDGTPIGPPSAAAFDDWDNIPLAVTDPADNPSALNIIDIKDIKIANDANFIYIYASGYKNRTNGLYLAFDTDQNLDTGFDIYGLDLVGSELGYVNDFPFDQRDPAVFNSNKPLPGDACCTGGPLDVDNGGAAMYPGWDVEFGEREWGIPLDIMWSVNDPLGPVFANQSFNFILWTDQALTDQTETISYTLAAPPFTAGDYNGDSFVDAADYTIWRNTLGSSDDLRANGDNTGASAGVIDQADYAVWKTNFGGGGAGAVSIPIPEPISACLLIVGALVAGSAHRRRRL
jgi:hypothetical protein